jgi:hypothetical protein
MPETITLKMRFEYLRGLYEETHKTTITYPDFMETIFSKLEQELRSGCSMLDIYHKKDIKAINHKDFIYDYDK